MNEKPTQSNHAYPVALTALFFTGFSGLVYEIVWVQMLGSVFGHTMYSISAVTAVYMAGLAAGSWIFGRRADRTAELPRLFLLLQSGIAVCSLLIVVLIRPMMGMTVGLFRAFHPSFYAFSLIKMLISFLVLFPPTLLMGGTFPLLARMAIPRVEETGTRVGRMYALNTAGSVAGCLLVGFFLIPTIGLPLSVLAGAILNVCAGLLVHRRMPTGHANETTPEKNTRRGKKESGGSGKEAYALILLGVLGFVSLAYEVFWARELSIVFFSSTYSVTIVLAIFLAGLGSGSYFLSGWRWMREKPWAVMGLLSLGIALLGMFSSMLLRVLPQRVFLSWLETHGGAWTAEIGLKFLVTFLILFPPTFLLGGVLPTGCRIVSKHAARIGSDIGRAYAVHTAGTIAGSLTAGFVLLPLMGVKMGLTVVSLFTMGLAAVVLTAFSESKSSILLIPVAFLGLIGSWPLVQPSRSFRELPPGQSTLYSKDDVGAEVRVTEDRRGDLRLYINEKKQGGSDVIASETWAGLVPMFMHPNPDSVLVIGLGTGITAGAVGRFPVERIRIVELIRSLKECAPIFEEVNRGILSDERVELVEGDGVNHLMMTQDRFDIILSDIVHPDDAGAGNLYSKEFYRTVLSRLNEDGLFAQWIVLDQFSEDAVRTFVATFAGVFPDATLWFGYEANAFKKCLLVGSRAPIRFDFSLLQRRLLDHPAGAALLGRGDVFAFLSFFIAGRDALMDRTAGAVPNSIWKPVLEFEIPKHRFDPGKGLDHQEMLIGWRSATGPGLNIASGEDREAVEEVLRAYRSARSLMDEGEVMRLRGYLKNAELKYRQARAFGVDPVVLAAHYVELGRAYMADQRSEDALRVTETAAGIDQTSAEAYRQLGLFYSMERRFEESETALRIALELNPEDFMAQRSLGIAYALEKRFPEALPLLEASLRRHPQQADVAYFIGTIYHELEDEDRARHYLRRSLEIDPGHRYRSSAEGLLRSR